MEFVPKTLGDLNIEGVSDGVNGTSHYSSSNSHTNYKQHHPRPLPKTYPNYKTDPFDPWSSVTGIFLFFVFILDFISFCFLFDN